MAVQAGIKLVTLENMIMFVSISNELKVLYNHTEVLQKATEIVYVCAGVFNLKNLTVKF